MPDEELLSEDTKTSLRNSFRFLQDNVVIELFTKDGINNQYDVLTKMLLRAVAALSDKMEVNVNSIGDEKSAKYRVIRSPTVLLSPEKYRIRYTGAPLGEEGRSFVQSIRSAT